MPSQTLESSIHNKEVGKNIHRFQWNQSWGEESKSHSGLDLEECWSAYIDLLCSRRLHPQTRWRCHEKESVRWAYCYKSVDMDMVINSFYVLIFTITIYDGVWMVWQWMFSLLLISSPPGAEHQRTQYADPVFCSCKYRLSPKKVSFEIHFLFNQNTCIFSALDGKNNDDWSAPGQISIFSSSMENMHKF